MLSELVPPVNHDLSQLMQITLIAASYIIWVALVLLSVRLGYQEKTPFYTVLVLAAGLCAIYEPIYDEVLMLYFYRPGQISLFTAFNIPQPIWTLSGYATLYASVAIFFTRDFVRGMTKATFWKYCVVEFITSCAFEMIAINGSAYEYWGPHVFRIFKYPLCIGLLETVQVICYSVFAARLRIFICDNVLDSPKDGSISTKGGTISQLTTPLLPYLSLLFLFPFTFMGSNVGIGAPLIIALHSSATSEGLVTLGSIATIMGVGVSLYMLSHLVPTESKIKLPVTESNENSQY